MPSLSTLLSTLRLTEAEGVPTGDGSEVRFCCPLCVKHGKRRDTKFHLYIHVREDNRFGNWICFRCGERGKLQQDTVVPSELDKFVAASRMPPRPKVELTLPDGFSPILPGTFAHQYLIGRGLNDVDIKYYELGMAGGRIIFPDYDIDGNLTYWVGRTYTEQEPRYYNCNADRSQQIYNLARFIQEDFKSAIITEGPISAIVAGRNAVATYGKTVAKAQIDILRRLLVRQVTIVSEYDARDQSLSLAKALCETYDTIFLLPMPRHHDPASLGREKFNLMMQRRSLRYDPYNRALIVQFILS
jgi:hypothetical protein